jgi:hypothetical protein
LAADAYSAAGDACQAINAAIGALPAAGGVVDARSFTGPQPCSVNPVSQSTGARFDKPFVLLLGSAVYQAAVPWKFGKNSYQFAQGQVIAGLGMGVSVIQPVPGFSGAVLQIEPYGPDIIVSNATFRDLSIDMVNAPEQTAIALSSVSNLPVIRDIAVINHLGTFVHIEPRDQDAMLPEGITFSGWYFYSLRGQAKVAPGILIENANEVVFRDGKILGDPADGISDGQVAVLITSRYAPGSTPTMNTATEGVRFVDSSIAFYGTGVRLTSGGPWLAPRDCSFSGLTLEGLDLGYDLAGTDAEHPTTGNQLIATRYVPASVRVQARFDHARYNLVEEPGESGPGAFVLTPNSSVNLIIRRFTQADRSDVQDRGHGNVVLGLLGVQGLQSRTAVTPSFLWGVLHGL